MDARRFDQMTRTLAGGASRRGVLAGLAAAVAGVAGLRATGAQSCPEGQVNRRGIGCVCRNTGRPPGPDGCPCPAGQERVDGRCVAVCAPGSKPCGAACIPNDRCCDGACGAGFVCENGGCFAACADLAGSCAGACGTECVCDVSTDAEVAGCADYDFGVGSCDRNADCPTGTRCSRFIVDGEGRNLCTRPCPCPA